MSYELLRGGAGTEFLPHKVAGDWEEVPSWHARGPSTTKAFLFRIPPYPTREGRGTSGYLTKASAT